MADPLSFEYDADSDTLTVEGIRYHGDYFRALGAHGVQTGEWFTVHRPQDGTVTVIRDASFVLNQQTATIARQAASIARLRAALEGAATTIGSLSRKATYVSRNDCTYYARREAYIRVALAETEATS